MLSKAPANLTLPLQHLQRSGHNQMCTIKQAGYYLFHAVHIDRCFISNTGQTPNWRASDFHGITLMLLFPHWNMWNFQEGRDGSLWKSRILRPCGISHATAQSSTSNTVNICQMSWDSTEVLPKTLSKRKAVTHHQILPRTMTPVWCGRDGSCFSQR